MSSVHQSRHCSAKAGKLAAFFFTVGISPCVLSGGGDRMAMMEYDGGLGFGLAGPKRHCRAGLVGLLCHRTNTIVVNVRASISSKMWRGVIPNLPASCPSRRQDRQAREFPTQAGRRMGAV